VAKHFIFDLGNVLIDFDLDDVLKHVLEAAGVSSLPGALRVQDTARVVAVETGQISDEEYLARICEETGLTLTLEQLIGVWRKTFQLNPAGNELFEQLRGQGHPVHFLSNIAWHNVEAVRRNWPDFFERGTENFFSYELGFHKPDERIYRAALEHLGAEPEECFFLDDRPENVAGARAVGIDAHLFSAEALPAVREALARFMC
jgi:putative hydrolase of the HAD superfamily